jgi:hypothetical protein
MIFLDWMIFPGLDLVLGLDKDGGLSGLDRFSGFGLFVDQVRFF